MKIILKKNQFDFLINQLNEENSELAERVVKITSKIELKIELDDNVIDEVRDVAGELLQKKGFDENYKLTTQGEQLQQIIDLLYVA